MSSIHNRTHNPDQAKASARYGQLLGVGLVFVVSVVILSHYGSQVVDTSLSGSTAFVVHLLQGVSVLSYAAAEYLVFKLARSQWRLSTPHAGAIVVALTLAFVGLVMYGPNLVYLVVVALVAAAWVLVGVTKGRKAIRRSQ